MQRFRDEEECRLRLPPTVIEEQLRLPAQEFRRSFRVREEHFDHIVRLIRTDVILLSVGNRPQAPVEYHFWLRCGDSA